MVWLSELGNYAFKVSSTIRTVFLCYIQVNGVNVVKVGHKQVVSLIRQGGSRLLMKVVSVTRKPESEEVVRKKGKMPTLSKEIYVDMLT